MKALTIFLLSLFISTGVCYTYPDFSDDIVISGTALKSQEIQDVIREIKTDYDADLIFARINISKVNTGYYDCCVRIPNLFCTNGNLTAEGWTGNVTIRCLAIQSIEYMLVFFQFNVTYPPVESPSDPPVLPPTEPTFAEYPLSNKIVIILLIMLVSIALLFASLYSYILLADRFCRKFQIWEGKPKNKKQTGKNETSI